VRLDGLETRLDTLDQRLRTTHELLLSLPGTDWQRSLWTRSRERWQADEPDSQLTWGLDLTGDAFVDRLLAHDLLPEGVDILEVGPGYGRILQSVLERAPAFGSYLGLELSAERVDRLRTRFGDDTRLSFEHGDVETFSAEQPFDVAVSSLVFKHLYPTFEQAAQVIGRALRPGGTLVFDVLEGQGREFQPDQSATFLRWYTRDEIEEILGGCGYTSVVFDRVEHAPNYERLLVIAQVSREGGA
jgi:SAM-dependent methyltransferase